MEDSTTCPRLGHAWSDKGVLAVSGLIAIATVLLDMGFDSVDFGCSLPAPYLSILCRRRQHQGCGLDSQNGL